MTTEQKVATKRETFFRLQKTKQRQKECLEVISVGRKQKGLLGFFRDRKHGLGWCMLRASSHLRAWQLHLQVVNIVPEIRPQQTLEKVAPIEISIHLHFSTPKITIYVIDTYISATG
jgi:hypothetical protein